MIRRLVSRAYYASKPAWEIYRSLLQTQFLACDELDQLQLHKLQRMIEHAGTVSPFWRTRFEKCGISTGSVDSLATLQRLPILEKEQLRTLVAEYGTDTARWVQKRSGGSTGKPITTYASPGHLYWSMASMLRFYSWIGYRSGDPRAKLFAMPTRMGIPEHTPYRRPCTVLGHFSLSTSCSSLVYRPRWRSLLGVMMEHEISRPELSSESRWTPRCSVLSRTARWCIRLCWRSSPIDVEERRARRPAAR